MRWFAILSLLFLPAVGAAQTSKIQKEVDAKLAAERKKKELALEDLLREALKHNADIRLAEARIHEAEAQMNKVRLETLQKVVMAYQQVAVAKAAMEEAKSRMERIEGLYFKKVVAAEEMVAARYVLQKTKAELAKAEAELPVLIGRPPQELGKKELAGADPTAAEVFRERLHPDLLGQAAPREMHEEAKAVARALDYLASKHNISAENTKRIREFLNTPMKGEFESVSPREVLDIIQRLAPKVNLHIPESLPIKSVTLSLKEPVPVAAVFQWFEDNAEVRFVIREYGIVIVPRENIPPGALPALDFWRAKEKTEEPQ